MDKSDKFNERRNFMQALAFGYKCQECGQGQVLERVFRDYKTKLKGYPLTVDTARIGVCDHCAAQHFDPNETARWRTLLDQQQSATYLRPTEIRELRKEMGLSMEQFSALLGCTRQSLYNWERGNRPSPQSRMADLFIRLVRKAHLVGQVDVLSFLTSEAARIGVNLGIQPRSESITPIVAITQKRRLKSDAGNGAEARKLAADTEAVPETVFLVTGEGQIAQLSYDYQFATLNLRFLRDFPFVKFNAEIELNDGTRINCPDISIKNHEAVLLAKTPHTEDEVAQVRLFPQELGSGVQGK
jgi:putative zinc finger/helix-turn-helix YgiT family protein